MVWGAWDGVVKAGAVDLDISSPRSSRFSLDISILHFFRAYFLHDSVPGRVGFRQGSVLSIIKSGNV